MSGAEMECCCCFFLTFETILWHLEITIKSHQVEKNKSSLNGED